MPTLKNIIIVPAKKRKPLWTAQGEVDQSEPAMNSQDYSALWGMCSGDWGLFYGVSSAPLDELDWDSSVWDRFANVIGIQLANVKAKPSDYDRGDDKHLEKLLKWAQKCAKIVRESE